MSTPRESAGSVLTCDQILAALRALSDLLGQQGVQGEICLFRQLRLQSAEEVLDLVGQYYPANRIPVRTQYLVEGLFEEGKL
jgi:hypothetical protein